jgi:glycosyltransferase involved in cell wall biosynthesis
MNGSRSTEINRKDRIIGLFSQAHSLAIDGNYVQALELYDKINANVPGLAVKTPQINYERALCLKALGRIHEAEQAIRSSLSVRADDPEYLRFLSEILFAKRSDISPGYESKGQSQSTNIKQANQVNRLYTEVKTFLPLVEERDVRLALKAISLIEKQIKGRLCGKLGDKVLQYLSIVQFVRATSSKIVDSIEIGTLFGGSCLTKLFAMRDLGVGGKVICIDPMSGYYGQPLDPDTGIAVTADVFFENVSQFGFPKESVELRQLKSNDPRAMEGLREQFYATLMIDGDHSYNGVRFDWENYNRFVCDKGIVLFDDYANHAWPDIGIFITELKDSFPRGWKELGCLGTTLLLGREIHKSKERAALREQQIERNQSDSTPLYQQRFFQNEIVVTPNERGMKKRKRVLLYTDSRGTNIRGHCDYMHYGARLAEQFNVDMYLCPEKWTTTLDFLVLCKHIRFEDYDAVILHTGIVDAAPRHQKVAIEQIYSTKKAIFDEIFGEQKTWQHLNTDLGCEYEGDKTINFYSLDMARECLLPDLKKIPNLIWIGGNRIVPGWRGNYWKERPANTSIVEQYFTLFASTLDHVVDLMVWNCDQVRQLTFDNVHPNKEGSDFIYERLLQQIDEVSRVVQRTTASSLPYSRHSLSSQNIEHNNELISTHDQNNVGSTDRMTLEMLANKYAGRRAFIIGNGPSLNKLDMTKLKGEITFGVNSIFYNFDKMGFKPTFYVVEDKLVAEDRAKEINELDGMTKIFGQYTKKYKLQDRDDVIWANVIVDYEKYPDFPHFSENAAACLWVGGTVSYLCMQLAYYMGLSEVYLVGFDHNYVIPADANMDGTIITSASDDPNHFHPEYFGKGKRWHDPCLERMELAYHRAKQVYEQNGRKIYNATVGGKLDIFPRVDYNRLFDGSHDYKYSSPDIINQTNSVEHAQTPISSVQDMDCEVARLKREGTYFYAQGDLSKAAAAFHRALTLAPQDAKLLCNLGFTSLKARKFEKSPAYFKAAIHLAPENAKYWAGLTIASHHEKDLETFNLAHEKIRNLDPALLEQFELGLQGHSWLLESEIHRSKEKKEATCTVSVIIPCYNTAKYLTQAIESVLKQTFSDFEIIVVDDGSTDNTPEVVKSFEDDHIHYIYQKNKGLAGARNTGIRHSNGRYITFLDADDYLLPNKLKDQVTFLQEHPQYGLVAGGFIRVDQTDNICGTFNAQAGEVPPEELLVQNRFVIHCTLIGRNWIERAGCFDESLRGAEEWDFHCRLVIAGCAMYRMDEAVCAYRFVPGSMSTDADLQTNSRLKVVEKVFVHKDLQPSLKKLESQARGYTHLKGAVHYYSLNRIEEGRQHLGRALKLYPQLRNNNYQKVVGLLVFWVEFHQLKSPVEYLDSVFSNLPAEAEDMLKLRTPVLNRAAEKYSVRQQRLKSADSSETNRASVEKVLASSHAELAQYKNKHRGQRCVIIGNGPSLNKMDLSFLKNEITFGMNRIYLLFDKWDFRPTYFISVNPLVIEQSVEEIKAITAPKFLALEGLPFIGTARENIFIQRRPGGAHFSDDPRNGYWWPTVTYAAMQLAYFMGFSEVILIGVDHYFKTKGDANKEIVSDGVDENHFHPDYFGKGIRWNLPDLERSETAYRLAKQAFEADGRRIIDATVDGHLTIYPKTDYRQIFDYRLPFAVCRLPVPNRKSKIENRKSPEYLVSAIVSTYNSERFLRGCLDDLEQQTTANKLQIIIVNSGSQENEETIVREYQQKYNNIVYIKTEQREGIYAAWNRAVIAARGTYLTNANTDDRHRKDALEIMAKTLQDNPDIALVYGDQICTDAPNGTFDNHHATEMAGRPEYSRERLLFGNCVGSQPMWRRSLHDEFGYFDETLTCAGDWDFWLRISNKYKLKHIPEFLGLYYYNEGGIEHGRRIHSLYERYIVGKRYGNPYISVIPQYKTYDNPLVSVIMPAYNAAEYIAEAIESVLIQNYRNFELVIINDGSTDNTEEIVASFKDAKIRYFRQENHGLAATHNTGIKKSRGKFITKLDADDKMTPDFISRHLEQFEKYPEADLVYCDDYLIDENDKPIRIIKRPEYTDRKLFIRDLFRCGYPIIPFRTCIRRSVFDKIGFFDESLLVGEDYDMIRRFVKHGLKISHLPSALYLRRMTENSLSRNSRPQKAKCHFDLIKRFTETFRYDELFPDVDWDEIPVDGRQLHAKCLAVVNYLAIGQDFLNSNSKSFYANTAFEHACSELSECLKIDPGNRQIRELLQKCELGRQRYEKHVKQIVC